MDSFLALCQTQPPIEIDESRHPHVLCTMHPDFTALEGLERAEELRQLMKLRPLPLHRDMNVGNSLPCDELSLTGQGIR